MQNILTRYQAKTYSCWIQCFTFRKALIRLEKLFLICFIYSYTFVSDRYRNIFHKVYGNTDCNSSVLSVLICIIKQIKKYLLKSIEINFEKFWHMLIELDIDKVSYKNCLLLYDADHFKYYFANFDLLNVFYERSSTDQGPI